MLKWIEDLRAPWPEVTDQGQRSTCLALAMTTSHEHATGSALSAEYLHWATGSHPGGRGNPHAAGLALLRDGQPPNEQWPYSETTDDTVHGYGPAGTVIGPFSRRRADRTLTDVAAVIQELRGGRWPVIALRVTDAFAAAGSGIVLPDGPGRAGHAVLAVGALTVLGKDLEPDLHDGDRLLCIRNSWGPGWGTAGHKLISEEALNECGIFSIVIDEVTP